MMLAGVRVSAIGAEDPKNERSRHSIHSHRGSVFDRAVLNVFDGYFSIGVLRRANFRSFSIALKTFAIERFGGSSPLALPHYGHSSLASGRKTAKP
jgi:hypothetical protein